MVTKNPDTRMEESPLGHLPLEFVRRLRLTDQDLSGVVALGRYVCVVVFPPPRTIGKADSFKQLAMYIDDEIFWRRQS